VSFSIEWVKYSYLYCILLDFQ